MRDVSAKYLSLRTSRATAKLQVGPGTIASIRAGTVPKADPIGVAKIAAIQAAKNTSLLIPYCHQVPLDHIAVEIELQESSMTVLASVTAIWKTGVEMEALTAATTAALTLYDMLKPIDDAMEIVSIRLLDKTGGKSSLPWNGQGLRAGVFVLSDSVAGGTCKDRSGELLSSRLKELGFEIAHFAVLPDDRETIADELRTSCQDRDIDLLVTTGGTGAGPRDVTPEATMDVIERRLEGIEQALRSYGQDRRPTAMLSRGVAGTRGKTLIINLPGSPSGVIDGLSAVFPAVVHAFGMMRGEGHDRV